MGDPSETKLILHVKGTDQTTSLPKPEVRSAIAEGKLKHSQLIWSPIHNAWKQVRELPHLWPSQKLAPAPPTPAIKPPSGAATIYTPGAGEETAPAPTPQVAPAPRVAVAQGQPRVATAAAASPVAQPRVAAVPTAQPRVAVAAGQPKIAASGATPQVAVARAQGVPVVARMPAQAASQGYAESAALPPDETPLKAAKWACGVVGGLLLLLLALNYFLVDHPLGSRLAQTPFAGASVHAHLGAFIQPNALVIHIGRSPAVNAANLPAFLVALAHSTPGKPGSGDVFDRVSLTPGWTGLYSFSGIAWDELGQMGGDDADKQRTFILNALDSASGQPLAGQDAPEDASAQVWTAFVRDFTGP